MGQAFEHQDMVFHTLVVGGTGSGKTNAVLYMLDLLLRSHMQEKFPAALILFDPAGDASIDLMRAIPESEWARATILDPQYVSFGFNPLSLPKDMDPGDKPEVLQIQVEEFSALLSDVFNTDAANAPRLMWIFKGALYYLYTFTPNPTFWELYKTMLDFTKQTKRETEAMLESRKLAPEIIQRTIEAIGKLRPEAYPPVINRISNFVLPPDSITFRTFCSRESKIDLEGVMEPGRLTIFRIPSSLPTEFKRLLASAIVMKLYFAALKRARRLEKLGQPPSARTPVILAADEFRDIGEMKILNTILSQSRKYGLYLWMVVQTLTELPEDLMSCIQANVGSMLVFRCGPDDAKKLSKLLYPQKAQVAETLIPGLEDYATLVRKRPVGGRPVEPPFRVTFPKLREPLVEYSRVLDFMRNDMEVEYGGAVGDTRLAYEEELEQEKAEKEESRTAGCPLGGPAMWAPLAYMRFNGPVVSYKEMCGVFEATCGWKASILKDALNKLVDSGLVREQGRSGPLFKGVDPKTAQGVWKTPESTDEQMRGRDVWYSLTTSAQKGFFEFEGTSNRAGGPLHVKAVKALLEQYWKKWYWCSFDRGERRGQLPDITVWPPIIEHAKGEEGMQRAVWKTKVWDGEGRVAVEVETNPSKNFDQIRKNYEKNAGRYAKVRFIVISLAHFAEVNRILQDKDTKTFEVVELDLGLDDVQLSKMIAAEEAVPSVPR